MRRTREETINFYRKDYLAGKPEEFILQFDSKDVNKQYAAIMNWKRSLRQQESSNNNEIKFSSSTFLKHLKEANNELENLLTLTPKDADKAREFIKTINYNIDNFERIKKQRILADLKKQEEKINKEGNSLRKKIAELQKELQ